MTRRIIAVASLAGYIATIFAANWLITAFGVVDVVPGPWLLLAPAGVYAVGAALVLRDMAHETAGLLWVLAAIAVGIALSALVASPGLVVASAAAFGLSELLDLAVYTPLRDRGWTVAALASSAVGLVVDSVVFLWLAFGSLAFLPGQVVGKAIAVVVAVAIGVTIRSRRPGRTGRPRKAPADVDA
ncbi:MAG TPA: VUT family protein [Streptosporangiaceae bacterium]